MVEINSKIFAVVLILALVYVAHSDDLLTLNCWACYSLSGEPDMTSCTNMTCSDIPADEGDMALYAFCVKTQMEFNGDTDPYTLYQAGCQVATSLDDNSYCDELANRTTPIITLTGCDQCRTDFCNTY